MKTEVSLAQCQLGGEAGHGGQRDGAGRPPALTPKKSYTMRLEDTTVERVERFAKSRGLDRTKALETMIEEYTLVLDGVMLPGRWKPEAFRRPGLTSILSDARRRK
jgi:hypothetical protein